MSWSITFIGKPAAIAAALEAESGKLNGQSKLEFDEAMPHLIGLVQQNFARAEGYVEPVLRLEASGSGYARGEEQIQRSATVKLDAFYGLLV